MKPVLVSSPRYWSKIKGYKLHELPISYMSLNQDSKCDANCEGCFRYPVRKQGLQNLLNMADYTKLLNEFHAYGGLALEISGEGEPLLSEHTLPIIRDATKLGVWTTLITNGHKLTEDVTNELKNLKVALVLSLHSLKKENYEKDCGVPGNYDIKMKNIDMVSKYFYGTSWSENGYLVRRAAVHWTLQMNNLVEVAKARRFCDERNLHFSIAPLAHVGHAAERPDLWLPEDLKRIEDVNNLGDESIIFYDDPSGREVCGTCKYGLNVGADGNLLLDAHGGYEVDIANIREISFQDAVEIQHRVSKKMFDTLDSFCPVRDPNWQKFLEEKWYLKV